MAGASGYRGGGWKKNNVKVSNFYSPREIKQDIAKSDRTCGSGLLLFDLMQVF